MAITLKNIIHFFRLQKVPVVQAWLEKRKKRKKAFNFRTMRPLLKEKLEELGVEKAESWFWAELIPFSSKVKARAKKGKGKKKKPAKANKKEVLTNFCSSEEECQIVAKCFRLLKRAFVKKKQYPKALEMLRLAGIFRALSPDEVAEGLQMAGHLQLGSGYWLGEAAVCYSQNGDETAKTILNHAARQGNELAEFILSLHSKAKQL